MTRLLKTLLGVCLLQAVHAYATDFASLPLNGAAAFEQLKMEYYIGALQVPSPKRDPDELAAQPGPKRMSVRVTAERWPGIRFAQQWNQLILINNPSRTLNQNLMDVLGFTSLIKEELIAGDQLTIDLTEEEKTVVSLNGSAMLSTDSPALFNMLVRTWIGPRPPSSEFKRDMLGLAPDASGSELLARYDAIEPTEARIAVTDGWNPVPAKTIEPISLPAQEENDRIAIAPPDNTTVRARILAPVPVAQPQPAPTKVAAVPTPELAPVRAEQAEPSAPPPAKIAAKAAPAQAVAAVINLKPVTAVAPQPPPAQAQVASAVGLDEVTPRTDGLDQKAQLQKALTQYHGRLRALINQRISYPKQAVMRNLEGLVVLRVDVTPDGQLAQVEAVQSAERLLDREALRAVRRAAPFPPTAGLGIDKQQSFLIPIVFKLQE